MQVDGGNKIKVKPSEEKAFLMQRGCRDGRWNASVLKVFEFPDPNLSTKLCICYDHQWLPPHMKPYPNKE